MCKINGMELKKAIKEAGMTQENVSMELGKAKKYISVACSQGTMSDESLDKLCILLDADRKTFTTETVKMTEEDKKEFEQYYLHGETVAQSAVRKGTLKKFITPTEFESELESLRNGADEEKLLAVAKATKIGVGNKTYMVIPVKILHMPEWQRNTVMVNAKHIADSYDEMQFEPIKVCIHNGKPYIIDGAHRAYAYILLGNEYIIAEVMDGNMESCIKTFLMQSIARKKMSNNDMWRASLKADVQLYICFREIVMKQCNLQVDGDMEILESPYGEIVPTRALLRMCHKNPTAFKEAIDMITMLEWNGGGNAYTNRNIKVIAEILEKHGTDDPTIEEKLLKRCKGGKIL